ncbi:MAG TPA: sigma-70 family RNA polymerase sigma factor [Gemmataceae bacterium]|nr:sigma-70 family RNA polymerase sigma factor [Gemmataceae bacterium]
MQVTDAAAFEACVRMHCGRLLVVARRILRNDEDANDAVQDAFLSAFKGISQFKGQSLLGTWLHRIVVRAALGRLRRRNRHPERSIEDLLPHFGDDEHQIDLPVPWQEAPDWSLQQEELSELVRRCIDRLPDDYRIVLLLRDIERLDSQETAQALETSLGVVKTRLHRARQALRTLLDPHFRRGDV